MFATEDVLFAQKLKKVLKNYKINSNVIIFKPNRPKDAKDRIWNIVSARNAIREYFLESDADYLIFMDADMIFDPEIVNELIKISKKVTM